MLELIGKISDSEMYEPLPSEEKKRAKKMLCNVEDAIRSNDAAAAALFMLEWAESFYGEDEMEIVSKQHFKTTEKINARLSNT